MSCRGGNAYLLASSEQFETPALSEYRIHQHVLSLGTILKRSHCLLFEINDICKTATLFELAMLPIPVSQYSAVLSPQTIHPVLKHNPPPASSPIKRIVLCTLFDASMSIFIRFNLVLSKYSKPRVYRIQVDQRFSSGIRDVRYT
jgi:hypothetical protein